MVMDVGAVSAVDHSVYRCDSGNDRADGVWVAEMMDAVEFLKEKDRMCRAICIVGGFVGRGDKCEIERQRQRECGQTCNGYIVNHPEEAVEIVERWAKEHPRKTRQDIYLEEQIPPKLKSFATITPKVDSNGALDLCPADVFCEPDCKLGSNEGYKKSTKEICDECRKAFWLREVE